MRARTWVGWRGAALVVVALAGVMLVACGSDEDTSSVAPAPGMSSGVAPSGEWGMTRPGGVEENVGGGAWADDRDVPPTAPDGYAGSYDGGMPNMGGGTSASALGRTIIRNGSVHIAVESVSDSFDRVREIAETAGGYVSQSEFRGSGESQSASLTLRVPAGQFGEVVSRLQELAVEVRSISSGSQDVTEEFTDLQSSLRNLRAVDQQYLTLLGEARAINDILLVQDRLASVRWEIERVQGRMQMIENLADMATVNVSLVPVEAAVTTTEPGTGFGDRVAEAWRSSLETLGALGTGLAVAIVWSWWLLPVAALLAWVSRRSYLQWRAERARRVDTPEAAA